MVSACLLKYLMSGAALRITIVIPLLVFTKLPPNSQFRGSPLAGCPRLLVRHIDRYFPYMGTRASTS